MGGPTGGSTEASRALPALLPESVRITVSAVIKPEEFLSLPAGVRASRSLSVC